MQHASKAAPRQPVGQLTWASGYVIARGQMVTFNADGSPTAGRNCFYLMSDSVFFTPQTDSD